MNLIIDIGNTNTKYSFFENNLQLFSEVSSEPSINHLRGMLNNYPLTDTCILAATGHIPEGYIEALTKLVPRFMEFNHKTNLPFISRYRSPETVGLDRLAGVAGAYSLYKGENVLIIDTGTAITFDLKNDKDEYLGGNISPGLNMRFKSLNAQTKSLPLIAPSDNFGLIGTNTQEAILNGVINGILFEIEGMIGTLSKNYTNLTVLLTGGDTHFFDNKLKKTIFVVQNLVSIGLNTILNYNVANI
jgi:type III pantothenate kinase